MGLDMYAESVPADTYVGEVDFKVGDAAEPSEVCYWRKHNALHGWMENLYRMKGGTQEFNCVSVNLTGEDLTQLRKVVQSNRLPRTQGFFFGQDSSQDVEEKERDLKFINDAFAELNNGRKVYYTSWW